MEDRHALTEEQAHVVAASEREALCVVSCAGSGKTRVLIERASRLVQMGDEPLLLLTFSRAAAEELRRRVLEVDLGRSAGARAVCASTFHALGLKILRSCDADALQRSRGRQVGFAIFGHIEQMAAAGAALAESGKAGSRQALLRSVLEARASQIARGGISDDAMTRGTRAGGKASAVDLYERKMEEFNAFDIDDLVSSAIRVLQREEALRTRWRGRFRSILVDEFQDATRSNFELLKLLVGPETNVTIVGDDDQSIYAFRGADRTIFEGFMAHFPRSKLLCLGQNHRSSATVVAAANAVVEKCSGRLQKGAISTERDAGDKVVIATCRNASCEASFLAQRIATLITNHQCDYSSIAVLLRTRALALDVRSRLQAHGIPTRLSAQRGRASRGAPGSSAVDGRNNESTSATAAALGLVRLLANENDLASFTTVAKAFNISEASLTTVSTAMDTERAENLSASSAADGKRAIHGVKPPKTLIDITRRLQSQRGRDTKMLYKFLYALDRLRQCLHRHAPKVSLRSLFASAFGLLPDLGHANTFEAERLLDAGEVADRELSSDAGLDSSFPNAAPPGDEKASTGDEEDMMVLLGKEKSQGVWQMDMTLPFDAATRKLRSLLDLFVQLEEDSHVSCSLERDSSQSAVLCTTIHQAKGLEWPAVFLPRLNDGVLPLETRGTDGSDEHIDEERRLCYVALSRARERLIISHLVEESNSVLQPSRFLDDLTTANVAETEAVYDDSGSNQSLPQGQQMQQARKRAKTLPGGHPASCKQRMTPHQIHASQKEDSKLRTTLAGRTHE